MLTVEGVFSRYKSGGSIVITYSNIITSDGLIKCADWCMCIGVHVFMQSNYFYLVLFII